MAARVPMACGGLQVTANLTPQELICEAVNLLRWVGVGSRVVRRVCEGAFRLIAVLVHRSGGRLSLCRVLCCV